MRAELLERDWGLRHVDLDESRSRGHDDLGTGVCRADRSGKVEGMKNVLKTTL